MAEREDTAAQVTAAAVARLGQEEGVAPGGPLAIPPKTRAERARRIVAYVLMVVLALLYLIPLAWTIVTSLKTQAEAAAGFDLWPENPSLAAYRDIWNRPDLSFVTFYKNSLLLAAAITAINLFLSTLGGYAFARLRFPLREVLFLLVLGTLMIPDQLRLVPVYLMMVDFPITDWNLVADAPGLRLLRLEHRARHEPLPHAPVLPHHPQGLRGGGQARRRRLLQDLPARHAAARGAGRRRRRHPDASRGSGTSSSGRTSSWVRAARPTGRCRSAWRSSASSTRPCGRSSWRRRRSRSCPC